jgi:hypothetical protein
MLATIVISLLLNHQFVQRVDVANDTATDCFAFDVRGLQDVTHHNHRDARAVEKIVHVHDEAIHVFVGH